VDLYRIDDAVLHLGQTDELGWLSISKGELAGARVLAIGTNWLPHEVDLPTEPPPVIRVELEPGASLEGIVVDADGAAIESARIAVWPQQAVPPPPERRKLHDPRNPVAISDELGRFRIRGLRHGTTYRVVAGRQGLVTRGDVLARVEDAVTIELGHLFAAQLCFVDEEGRELQCSESTLRPSITLDIADPGQHYVGSSVALRFAGVPPEMLKRTATRLFVAVTGPRHLDSIGPIALRSVEVPGYRARPVSVMLPTATNGVAVQNVAFERVASAFGRIQLSFLNAPRGLALGRLADGWSGKLLLRAPGSTKLEYAIRTMAVDSVLIEPVPYGDYEGVFVGMGGIFLRPPPPGDFDVSVGPDLVELSIDLGGLGGVRFELSGEDDEAYEGTFSASLFKGNLLTGQPGIAKKVDLAAPPYAVFGLEPSVYTLMVHHPNVRGSAHGAPKGLALQTFVVDAGELATHTLRLAE